VAYRRLNLPNEDRLLGAGIYYGAGASEAAICAAEDDVFVVGGGNSAGQAAMFFAEAARSVSMVILDDCLKDTLSQYLVDRIESSPKVRVLKNSQVVAVEGDESLHAIVVENRATGERQTYATRRLFICIGGEPHTKWAEEVGIQRDEEGYLMTGPDLPLNGVGKPVNWPLDRNPFYLETSIPGVFAAGDVRHGSIKRCASAVGEGAMAVAFVHRYLAGA
jgi:thioredoxin reductase (NADPH)